MLIRDNPSYIKLNATNTVTVGPFLNSSGAPVINLTFIAADVKIQKGDGATFNNMTGNPASISHAANGFYNVVLGINDCDVAGKLTISINKTGCLPVVAKYHVKRTYVVRLDKTPVEVSCVPAPNTSHEVFDGSSFNVDFTVPNGTYKVGNVLVEQIPYGSAADIAKYVTIDSFGTPDGTKWTFSVPNITKAGRFGVDFVVVGGGA